jgi:hypothetical protein
VRCALFHVGAAAKFDQHLQGISSVSVAEQDFVVLSASRRLFQYCDASRYSNALGSSSNLGKVLSVQRKVRSFDPAAMILAPELLGYDFQSLSKTLAPELNIAGLTVPLIAAKLLGADTAGFSPTREKSAYRANAHAPQLSSLFIAMARLDCLDYATPQILRILRLAHSCWPPSQWTA